mgnify:CR=1 FL=1
MSQGFAPFYDVNRTYEDNYLQGPFGAFAEALKLIRLILQIRSLLLLCLRPILPVKIRLPMLFRLKLRNSLASV